MFTNKSRSGTIFKTKTRENFNTIEGFRAKRCYVHQHCWTNIYRSYFHTNFDAHKTVLLSSLQFYSFFFFLHMVQFHLNWRSFQKVLRIVLRYFFKCSFPKNKNANNAKMSIGTVNVQKNTTFRTKNLIQYMSLFLQMVEKN